MVAWYIILAIDDMLKVHFETVLCIERDEYIRTQIMYFKNTFHTCNLTYINSSLVFRIN